MDRPLSAYKSLLARAKAPVDIASVAVFRIVFGAAMLVATARFFVHDWVREYALTPTHFFHFWGFGWIHPWSGNGMYVHYALMGLAALLLTIGLWARLSALLFGALFVYAHFIDKVNYLNHYYFVGSLSLLLAFMPIDRAWSIRALWWPSQSWSHVPAWCVWMLRFQVGCVYVFGGIAKLNADWLFCAQPLTSWLGANTEMPLIGRWLHLKQTAYAFSWAGAFYDLTIVGWLLWRRSRPFAYMAVLVFHLLTARLFQIGMFPWVMIAATPIFFSPSWPRVLLARLGLPLKLKAKDPRPMYFPASSQLFCALFVVWHLLVPLRHWAYPGNMLWTEQGFRFSWNVMLIEKNGALDMTVVDRRTGARSSVDPLDYLTRYQAKMMSTQPDMILEFAHMVADDYAKRGVDVAVYADVQVTLNGRRPAPLIDPNVDLSREKDTLASKNWILPMPTSRPEF